MCQGRTDRLNDGAAVPSGALSPQRGDDVSAHATCGILSRPHRLLLAPVFVWHVLAKAPSEPRLQPLGGLGRERFVPSLVCLSEVSGRAGAGKAISERFSLRWIYLADVRTNTIVSVFQAPSGLSPSGSEIRKPFTAPCVVFHGPTWARYSAGKVSRLRFGILVLPCQVLPGEGEKPRRKPSFPNYLKSIKEQCPHGQVRRPPSFALCPL